MLSSDIMRKALRTFADRNDDEGNFTGFPGDESDARTKWGEAFFAYVSTIAPPVSTALVMVTFHDTLRLERSFMPMPATSDLAAAWRAALVSTGTPWDEPLFTQRETQLRTTLKQLLGSPSIDAYTRLDGIAQAFHAATVGLTAGAGATVYG
jgi:hypothetical protein